jgi:hypothetical protein
VPGVRGEGNVNVNANAKQKGRKRGRRRWMTGWVCVGLAGLIAAAAATFPGGAAFVAREKGTVRQRLMMTGRRITYVRVDLAYAGRGATFLWDGTHTGQSVARRWSSGLELGPNTATQRMNEQALDALTSFDGVSATRVDVWGVVTVLAAAGFGLVAWSWSAARRFRAGCCARCGYDLLGLGAVAVCPECGADGGASRKAEVR